MTRPSVQRLQPSPADVGGAVGVVRLLTDSPPLRRLCALGALTLAALLAGTLFILDHLGPEGPTERKRTVRAATSARISRHGCAAGHVRPAPADSVPKIAGKHGRESEFPGVSPSRPPSFPP